jgi:hypothetical protein
LVRLANAPLRPHRRSVEWCLKGVEQCWSQKRKHIATAKNPDAEATYEHARQTCRNLLAQTQPP